MVVFGTVDSDSFVVAETNNAHGAPKAVTRRHTEVFRRQDVDAFKAYFCCYLAEGIQRHLLIGPAYYRLPNPIFGIRRVLFLQNLSFCSAQVKERLRSQSWCGVFETPPYFAGEGGINGLNSCL